MKSDHRSFGKIVTAGGATRQATIAIVAPSGYAPNEAALPRAWNLLEAQGCRVVNYYDHASRYHRFGATDQARVEQLHAAAKDPEIDIVMALRGGYGLSRLLPLLDLDLLASSGKRFVGHSDFTALQLALLEKSRTVTFAGPMICDDFTTEEPSDFTMAHFWSCMASASHAIKVSVAGNPSVSETGMLWGGNLAMLAHLIGTPYFPKIDNGVLFIEDINEHPFRVERMLLQLLHAGVLQRQRAIVLGDFSGYRLSEYDNGYDFEAMLAYIRSRLTVPLLVGLPFGHTRDKVTLAMGGHAHIVSDADGFTLTMSDYQ